MTRITSTANPRVKQLARLRRRRARDETGRFLVEGEAEIARALDAGVPIEEVWIDPEKVTDRPALAGTVGRLRASGVPLVETTDEVLARIAYRRHPSGIVAVVRRFDVSLDRLTFGSDALVLVAEAIEKPGNLGTMLRTADAAGADAVIVADPVVDPFNPNVVRASLGALFTVPLAVADAGPVIDRLRSVGLTLVAADAEGPVEMWDAPLARGVAIVIGAEHAGLGERWRSEADVTARIPLYGQVDSLNAAMAAGLFLYEARRQRRTR